MLIRAAVPEDALAVAGVHVRSWQAAYRGLLPDPYLDGLRAEDRAAKYDFAHADLLMPKTIVAVDGGTIRGFATTMPSRDADTAGQGELCALHADPAWWGRGVGAELVKAARGQMVEAGFTEALLWVLAGNARAFRFYERDGWKADGMQRSDVVWDVAVEEIRFRRTLQAVQPRDCVRA